MIFRPAHSTGLFVCAFPGVYTYLFLHECVSGVFILAASARSCVCVCVSPRESLLGTIAAFHWESLVSPLLRTGCPSCNMITVTTVAITVTTEPQVNKGGGGGGGGGGPGAVEERGR